MMESMVQSIEDKVMKLVSEMETLRREVQQLRQDNHFMKTERDAHRQKLQSLVSMLETFDRREEAVAV